MEMIYIRVIVVDKISAILVVLDFTSLTIRCAVQALPVAFSSLEDYVLF
jgi:hypothetical protein